MESCIAHADFLLPAVEQLAASLAHLIHIPGLDQLQLLFLRQLARRSEAQAVRCLPKAYAGLLIHIEAALYFFAPQPDILAVEGHLAHDIALFRPLAAQRQLRAQPGFLFCKKAVQLPVRDNIRHRQLNLVISAHAQRNILHQLVLHQDF